MLVLTRKKDQVILVGDNIRIVIVGVTPTRVRIGIEAPESERILRGEAERESDEIRD